MNTLYIQSLIIEKNYKEWDYFGKIPAINSLKEMRFNNPVIFFVGENGSGKSTLMEALAVGYGFNPEGGAINHRFSTNDSHSKLDEYIKIKRSIWDPKDGFFLRAESFYNFASYIEEKWWAMDRFGGISFHDQSHGESFINLVKNGFKPNGIYLLDEPEAALSLQRQLALIFAIDKLVEQGCQFIIVTHSPILLAMKNATIYNFDGGKIDEIDYEDIEHYQITKMVLYNRDNIMDKLQD